MRFPMLLLPAVLLLACGWNYDMKSLGPEQCRLHLADRRSQTAQPGPQGIRLAWNAGSYRRAELLFTDRPLLPPFRRATIALELAVTPGTEIQNVHLRLQDASSETLSWIAVEPKREADRLVYRFTLTPENASSHWVGNRNGKIDFPARLHDIAVVLQPGSAGTVTVERLTFSDDDGEQVTALRTIHDFSDRDWWEIVLNPGRSYLKSDNEGAVSLTPGENQLTVTASAPGRFLLRDAGAQKMEYRQPVALLLDAELTAGEATFRPIFAIRGGSWIADPGVPLRIPTGRGKLRYDLARLETAKLANTLLWGLDFKATSPDGARLLLHGVELEYRQSPAEAVDFAVSTGETVNVLAKGKEGALRFRLANRSGLPVKANAAIVLEDYFGRRLRCEKTVALEAGGASSWAPEIELPALGVWLADYEISVEGDPRRHTGRRSFAYLEPAGPNRRRNPEFTFGICTHSAEMSPADAEREALLAALCGAKSVRAFTEWYRIQRSKDSWDFRTADRILALYDRYHIRNMFTLAATPLWAAEDGIIWSGKPDHAAWRRYVAAMAERYKGRFANWEIWNEPDLRGFAKFDPEEYVRLLEIACRELRKADPGTPVMIGGFSTLSGGPGPRAAAFHREALLRGKGFFDIHCYHEHGTFEDYALLVDSRFLPLRRETGTTVPWFSNETSITSAAGSEKRQAVTLFKKLVFAWSRGAIGYSWYDLRNDGFSPTDWEHNFGMTTYDFQPKFVYGVYNTLASVLGDARFVRDWSRETGCRLFEFRSGRQRIFAGWNRNNDAEQKLISIGGPASRAALVDLMGNRTPRRPGVFQVGRQPALLVLEDAGESGPAGLFAELSLPGAAVPGRALEGKLRLRLPEGPKQKCAFTFTGTPGVEVLSAPGKAMLAPGEEKTIPVKLRIRPEAGNAVNALRAAIRFDGKAEQYECAAPVHFAVPVPAKDIPGREPEFLLDKATDVYSSFGNDPANTHMLWSGPKDLSARIFLAADETDFTVRVRVRDDVHIQEQTIPAQLWKDDCVQFRLLFPGQRGAWEIGAAGDKHFVWYAPEGFVKEEADRRIRSRVIREKDETVYEIRIPLAALGIGRQALRDGFRFNLIVNDNDGQGRKGWIQVAPGLGGNKDAEQYPFVVFEE